MKQIVYAAFDLFPSPKGAATHIGHNVLASQQLFERTHLLCLGSPDMPRNQQEGSVQIRRCLLNHPNVLRRAKLFEEFVEGCLDQYGHQDVIHFRDIWSGVALLDHPATHRAKAVFEVNGVPSIELPCHYPLLHRRPALLQALRASEDYCLDRADVIVTVSRVNAHYLEQERGVDSRRIQVIPNCVRMTSEGTNPALDRNENEIVILYSGTLSPWQGLVTLIKAFSYLPSDPSVKLVMACSTKKHFRPIDKWVKRLGLTERVQYLWGLSRADLDRLYAKAYVSVAPLSRCDRNELQGCCPLKILESMAMGTPVVASDLGVCRELIRSGEDGILIKPDAPRVLARSLIQCLENPALISTLGENARKKIGADYSFERLHKQLFKLYQN